MPVQTINVCVGNSSGAAIHRDSAEQKCHPDTDKRHASSHNQSPTFNIPSTLSSECLYWAYGVFSKSARPLRIHHAKHTAHNAGGVVDQARDAGEQEGKHD